MEGDAEVEAENGNAVEIAVNTDWNDSIEASNVILDVDGEDIGHGR